MTMILLGLSTVLFGSGSDPIHTPRAVHQDPEPDPPVPTVRSGPITGRPDAGDGSAAGLYFLNPKTAGRLAGLRLRNRYLTDPTVSDRKSHLFCPIS